MASHAPGGMPLSFLPSPADNGFNIGPLFIHVYGLMYVVGIALAIYITRRRWKAAGGDPTLVADMATWAVPAGIIGGRIYFDITTPGDIPHHWWGIFAVWSGGLGVWGGIAAGALAGVWRVHRAGASWQVMANAIAPALLVAQAVGRIGNYFNQELFGKPSTLPWALSISPAHRPAGFTQFATFQPTFLYELIWDLALAAVLVWLGHHRKIRPPGLFALYIAGYSAFRIFEESIRIDSSEHFLGLRLNFYVAAAGVIAGLVWFVIAQRRSGPFPEAGPPSSRADITEAVAEAEAEAEQTSDGEAVNGEPGGGEAVSGEAAGLEASGGGEPSPGGAANGAVAGDSADSVSTGVASPGAASPGPGSGGSDSPATKTPDE